MVTFKINNVKVLCPTEWSEVSISSVLKMKGKTHLTEIFQALTGCDFDIPEFQVRNEIFPYLTFVSDEIDFEKLPMPEFIKGWGAPIKNLGHASFGQKIAAQKIISKAFRGSPREVDVTSFMIDLLIIYMPKMEREKVESLPFVQCYPVFDHYCKEIIRLVGRDKKYLEQKPDADLTLAGIDKLSKFAEMRIIDALAEGDLLKYEKILEMEYDVIFRKLWYVAEQSSFKERYMKIRERKFKQAAA